MAAPLPLALPAMEPLGVEGRPAAPLVVLIWPDVATVTVEAASASSEPATAAPLFFARPAAVDGLFLPAVAAAGVPEERRLLDDGLVTAVAGFGDESYLSSLPAEVTLAAWIALILAIQDG